VDLDVTRNFLEGHAVTGEMFRDGGGVPYQEDAGHLFFADHKRSLCYAGIIALSKGDDFVRAAGGTKYLAERLQGVSFRSV
jgi:hypothetical protein